jgi:hypothetical protein
MSDTEDAASAHVDAACSDADAAAALQALLQPPGAWHKHTSRKHICALWR